MHSEIEDFLGGTFHQDIESPKDALEEFIKELLKQVVGKQLIIMCGLWEQKIHRGEGNHTRHNKPSELTPSQRAKEIENTAERGN